MRMMEEFTASLYDDLRELRHIIASHSKQSKTLYEESKNHMEGLKVKVQETFESVTEDIKVNHGSLLRIINTC